VGRFLMTISLSLALVCAALAQEVRSFHGRVLYIAGNSMGFAPDIGGSFDVDLTQVDQTSYAFLKSGDAVTVVGVVTPDGNKLIAVSITPDR
jgi:hypothetical protein